MSEGLLETVQRQTAAASPAQSAFVAANAGSGKTRVLIDRVARLLLTGADPAGILCITYTKAAAAEMSSRLFSLLGEWALLPDDDLREKLQTLESNNVAERSDADLSRARRLFARALETPGGLKIQTIHAFCSHVLKRFPLEAGVPPGFDELEDHEADLLIDMALSAMLKGKQQGGVVGSYRHLCEKMGADQAVKLLRSQVKQRQRFIRYRQTFGDANEHRALLAKILEIPPDLTLDQVKKEAVKALPISLMRELIPAIKDAGGKVAKDKAKSFGPAIEAGTHDARYAVLMSLLTAGGTRNTKVVTGPLRKAYPDLAEQLHHSQVAAEDAYRRSNSIEILNDSVHFISVMDALLSAYEEEKSRRAVVDFDDLIMRTHALLAGEQSATQWVLYKLDNGLQHILLDEAQDTSPGQWDVIEHPMMEFFTTLNDGSNNRTAFIVGDEKQSIYSFQGADASLFQEKIINLGKDIDAAAPFQNIPLTRSFRSTAPVLKFVDAAFNRSEVMQGVGSELPLTHDIHRTGEAGLVEVWPAVPQAEKDPSTQWDAPLDTIHASNPIVILCDFIAEKIAGWLGNGCEMLEAHARPIVPSDIIILVQKRDALFRQMIKSLTRARVPMAGADRIKLDEDIAIADLVSLGRFVLHPDDDLSLAEILKSPLFGFDDDALFELAANRTGTLWAELKKRAAETPILLKANRVLSDLCELAEATGPFDFYTSILEKWLDTEEQLTGRALFYRRLGQSCSDTLDAFMRQCLDFETQNPRSLQGFLHFFSSQSGEIKRELDQESEAVRIMTVHGAKGLEGNIVFLLGAHQRPTNRHRDPVFLLSSDAPSGTSSQTVPALVRASPFHVDATREKSEALKDKSFEEYRRLFYVAATRARDRLYICGLDAKGANGDGKNGYNDENWLQLSRQGVDALKGQSIPSLDICDLPDDYLPWGEGAVRISSQQASAVEAREQTDHHEDNFVPPWLKAPIQAETSVRIYQPSTLADRAEERAVKDDPAAPSAEENVGERSGNASDQIIAVSPVPGGASGHGGFFRGQIIHRMLEILPVAASMIAEKSGGENPQQSHADLLNEQAKILIAKLAPDLAKTLQEEWVAEVMAILTDPVFAPLFGEGSRAEVSLGGHPEGARDGFLINGQVDRLVVTNDEVLIIDYKTNQPPPLSEDGVSKVYLAQMAAYRGLLRSIYPGKPVRTGLLWTYDARLMPLSDEIIDHAFARFLA